MHLDRPISITLLNANFLQLKGKISRWVTTKNIFGHWTLTTFSWSVGHTLTYDLNWSIASKHGHRMFRKISGVLKLCHELSSGY